MNPHAYRFYSLLVLLYFSDMVLLLANIWNSLRVTNSPLFLGCILSIGVIFPLILKKLARGREQKSISLAGLYLRRIIVFAVILVESLFAIADTWIGFIITSLCIGYLSLLTLTVLEAANTKLVLQGHISSQMASRTMQTIVQLGSFFGAMASGYLLLFLNYNKLIALICIFDIIVSATARFIFSEKSGPTIGEANRPAHLSGKPLPRSLIYLCIVIALVGLHISAFNVLTPIIFQKVKNLNSEYFGLCSAVAGLGAFSAAFVNLGWFRFLIPAIVLLLADLIFTLSWHPYMAIVACLFIGFSINTIRIHARKTVIDKTSSDNEADQVSSLSALMYTLAQSIGPMVFGILTGKAVLGAYSAIYLFPAVALIMFVWIVLVRSSSGAME
ncbi:hypothetical protein H3V17_01105 [Bartonella sp. M0283]|nr:hypothetical protein [Bartonella sp. M0283]